MDFEHFWTWLQLHPNCILRVATSDIVLYDDEDFHWHFAVESDEVMLLQVIRGKRYVGELALRPAEVALVQCQPGEMPDEYSCDMLDVESHLICQVVMSHGPNEGEPPPLAGRAASFH